MDDGDLSAHVLRAREVLDLASTTASRVLDFGAGEGHLVAALHSLGVDASGVEPSAAGRQEARRRYGIELGETLPAEPAAPAPDLIVLLHSLEHVVDPVGVLRALGSRLAPRGSILIEVPNAASFEMLLPAGRRKILDLPVHLYHFTPRSLSTVVEASGLRVLRRTLTNPQWLERILALRTPRESVSEHETKTGGGGCDERSLLRSTWRSGVLPWIRSRAPGWKFQLVAAAGSAGRTNGID
jgi:SAM-dependent methyltransferase